MCNYHEAKPIEHGIGPWIEKPWGHTRTIYRDAMVEIIECEIKKGGYCSEHLHKNKHNEFRVLSGLLQVDASELGNFWPSQLTKSILIPAGTRHSFTALEDTRLIETYLPAGPEPIDPADIERFTSGGMRE